MPEENIPAVMRAARLHQPGEPLSIDGVAVPGLGPRDLHIAVKACGVIPNMNAIYSGTLWNRLPPLPASVRPDAAGVVVKTGHGGFAAYPAGGGGAAHCAMHRIAGAACALVPILHGL